MNITQNLSPNFNAGRQGRKPIAIVNHITDGAFPGCMTWLCNPQSQGSSHYIVTKAGQVYQLVKDEDTAWCNGIIEEPTWPLLIPSVNPNLYTLSIEHEGRPTEPLTEAQYQATLELHRILCAKWGIPADRQHIIGHYEIQSKQRANCPGPFFPWERLLTDLNSVRVRINGKFVDTFAKLEDGRTLVHVRFAEHLGYNVAWDGTQRIVDIRKG